MKRKFNDLTGRDKINGISQIQLKNVSFTYPNADRPSLYPISFTINKGEKIAVVGQNASGKSTLFKLLADLFEPSSGEILIDGKSLKTVDFESYWKKISPVFQDFSKFKLTVYSATSFNDDHDTNVRRALDFSGLSDLKESSQLGQEFDGIDLSGGQWQKLAIARAFYKKNCELYLFDEANSALDVQSEKQLYQKLMELASGKTVIWITHRMTSVKLADKVLFLEKGQIKGFDRHENLMKNENYSKLYQEQFDF